YGHDVGDQYIILAAQMLTRNMQKNAVVGRMSGDEFYVFLYDFESKNTVRELLKKTYASFENNMLVLPDGELFKLRMSGGIAWYGDETILHDELMRYADFAMYEGKNSVKGTVHEFDKEAYDNESFMLSGREELNKVLENKLADFVFQPIISTKTGEIYGYESLMRPRSKVLTSPLK
ncbi:MAG: diguanylate cyclase, partial [Christensenellaceae bacterium]